MDNFVSNDLEIIWNFNGNPVRLRHTYDPVKSELTVWYYDLKTGKTMKGEFVGFPPAL